MYHDPDRERDGRGATTTTTPFGVELQQPADKVTATITDKDGKVVRTIDIGELKAGVHTFTQDGTMTDGTAAPSGSYNVAISASNGGRSLWRSHFSLRWCRGYSQQRR